GAERARSPSGWPAWPRRPKRPEGKAVAATLGPSVASGSAMDSPRRSRRLVLRLLWPGRRASVALAVAILAAAVLPLAAPQLTREFVDGAVGEASTGTLTSLALGYLGLALAGQ